MHDYTLDDKEIHADYAARLIPRAVGYSTALIDYFFRGKFEVGSVVVENSLPEVDGTGSVSWTNAISAIRATVRNISDLGTDSNGQPIPEPIGNGTVIAVARFSDGFDNFQTASSSIPLSQSQIDAMNSANPPEISFDFSPAIPAGSTDLTLLVVFQGSLGNEADIAVAVGRKDVVPGTLTISPPAEYVYSVVDGGVSLQQFTHIKAGIKNTTQSVDEFGNPFIEEIQDGQIYAVARYKTMPGYLEDLSTYPASALDLQSLMANEPFSTSYSAPIDIATAVNPISSTTPTDFVFDFTNATIPVGITDLTVSIVFEGTIGIGQDFAMATGMVDLNEPQQMTFWNSTDERTVNNSYVEPNPYPLVYDFIVAFTGQHPDPVNNYSFGLIPGAVDFYAAYVPVAVVERLDPGRHFKLIYLTDQPTENFVLVDSGYKRCIMPGFYMNIDRVTNQDDGAGCYLYTPLSPPPTGLHRGLRQHRIIYYNDCNGEVTCEYLPDLRSVPPDLTPTFVNLNFPPSTYSYSPPVCGP